MSNHPSAATASADQSADAALLNAIAERSATDPLIGAKIGSKEVTQRLIAGMKDERGVHVESLLCALGALAGYACQAAVRAQALAQGLAEDALLTSVQAADGKTYFFGDALNGPLAEARYSVWGIAAAGAETAGCQAIPDVSGIFRHVSEDLGTANFGVPRIPPGHKPGDLPMNYLQPLWPLLTPVMAKFCPDRTQWPILLALSVQEVIIWAKSAIDPALAFTIVMESAIPMSKVDLPGS